MADETTPAPKREELLSELERSRESAARLMEALAQKMASISPMRGAAGGLERAAHYVQAHSVREMAAGVEGLVRKRPVYSIAAAVIAGFLVGRAMRSR